MAMPGHRLDIHRTPQIYPQNSIELKERMLYSLFVSIALFFSATSAQQTKIKCSPVNPINVPKDPSLYWGTWYTVGTCSLCADPSNVCSQVSFEPVDATKASTNLTYIGSFQTDQPYGTGTQAFGTMIPIDLVNFNPLYRLNLDLGFAVIPADYYILTTAGDGKEISAIVTMSCNTTGSDMQLFYLSRKPYFVAPVTFDLLESQVKRAINNYDEFTINAVVQAEGWCDYQLVTTYTETTTLSCDESDTESADIAKGASIAASVFSALILILVVYAVFFRRPSKDSDMSIALTK